MNADIKTKWVAALRSGDYKQGIGRLRTDDDGYCCLGVLCDVIDPDGWQQTKDGYFYRYDKSDSSHLPPTPIRDYIGGVSNEVLGGLTNLNDIQRKTFDEIADVIEKGL